MLWFVNESSLQGQFDDDADFLAVLRGLLDLRHSSGTLKNNLRVTRMLPQAQVARDADVRALITRYGDRDLQRALLTWIDRTGPFIDDDRAPELDDFFEFEDLEVTSSGLGEAARRTKKQEECSTFSFEGGGRDFARDPLAVDHGLPEERYGRYEVRNLWELEALERDVARAAPPITSWEELIDMARERFANLDIGDLHRDAILAREPFEASIAKRAMSLLALLDTYAGDRSEDGAEGVVAREVVDQYFKGDRAPFSGESETNRRTFDKELTFDRGDGEQILAHWHGKISHRTFRLHFEWPLEAGREKLAVVYLGPKITKT